MRRVLGWLVLVIGLAVVAAATLFVFGFDFMNRRIVAIAMIPYAISLVALGVAMKIAYSKLAKPLRQSRPHHWQYDKNDPDFVNHSRYGF